MSETTKITNLPDTGLDAGAVATNTVDLFAGTELAGLLPEFTRMAVLALRENMIAVTFVETPLEPEDTKIGVFADTDEAAVEWRNTLDLFRREGWTLRDPEPWELPDPLASDARPTF